VSGALENLLVGGFANPLITFKGGRRKKARRAEASPERRGEDALRLDLRSKESVDGFTILTSLTNNQVLSHNKQKKRVEVKKGSLQSQDPREQRYCTDWPLHLLVWPIQTHKKSKVANLRLKMNGLEKKGEHWGREKDRMREMEGKEIEIVPL